MMVKHEESEDGNNIDLKSLHYAVGLTITYSFCAFKVFDAIYNAQPTPYLDEVFHIPQANKYCNGSFTEWDPKITTLPGLYIFSIGFLKPFSWILNRDYCTTYGLRFTNLLFSIANLILVIGIRHKILECGKKFPVQLLWGSLNLALFPVLYFFTFLYYTDQISTLLVLLMYRLYLGQNFNCSALAGLISVICRQTNIIWVAFFAIQLGLESLEAHLLRIQKKKDSRKYLENLMFFFSGLLREPRVHMTLVKDLIKKEAGYVMTGVSFLAFLWVNKGIVVGDRSAHQAVINLPQIFYFSMFFLFFSFPYAVVRVKKFCKFVFQNPVFVFCLVLISIAVVAFNTEVHPYLLADNRHYTFYLWRYYKRHWSIPYILVASHVFGLFSVYNCLGHNKYSFQLAFYACFFLSLVFQKLLEFRYFILPFLIIRLNMKVESRWQLLLEFLIFLCSNAYTINLFLTRTFSWADSPDVQRFMW
ncbi:dol-P-Glc:Glc(2)Man(9)GlcNAc(2)-PP-Dol alpha-1,2-glucosyltransferase [Hetaerina americana]|uniref:dol-P-Glc:Glc(2)Man(9)GlcNAc(2)-PP-Dol alpha-1,2-glucosyltransferase n=1 Tax=Hetaerina americana TaxID=62018 RepID=UPI003A7F211D